MKQETYYYLKNMFEMHQTLKCLENDIIKGYEIMKQSFQGSNKLLVCGNGGSAGDADHIVGELMKGFLKTRPIDENIKENIEKYDKNNLLSRKLQMALPAINLSAHCALLTALCNDIGQDVIFAQQVLGYGRPNDVLLGISTSGNSENVVCAGIVAKALGLKTIGLTGQNSCKMDKVYDVMIKVPSNITPIIQDMHRPVYHALCAMLEEEFFG